MEIKESSFYKGFKEISLKNKAGMELVLTSCGAGIKSVKLNGLELSLTPYDKDEYIKGFQGKMVGRVCGRILNASYTQNGIKAELEKNNFDVDNIHGGSGCFRSREFSYMVVENNDYTDTIFSLFSPDGEAGFIGNVMVYVTYRFYENENKYQILIDGNTDTFSMLNMTNHIFLNLNGNCSEPVINHEIFINSKARGVLNERYVCVDKKYDPKFDFSKGMTLGKYINDSEVQNPTMGYDHPFFLENRGLEHLAARAYSPKTGISCEVRTSYPCVVIYTDNQADTNMLVNETKHDEKYLGICFECQYNPNSIHMSPNECGFFDLAHPYHEVIEFKYNKEQ